MISSSPTSPTSPMSPIFEKMGPRVLALVIGINEYSASDEYPNLKGAVRDAEAFETFLKTRLNVPDENIINLRDERASRAAILEALSSLRDDPRYKKDEAAIIIFYAGHGAQVDKPEEWVDWVTSTGKIEMLCPSDIGKITKNVVNGEEVEEITPGIPDRTISTILNHISDIKGNNITLILDCCSSGGIARGEDVWEEMKEYTAREITTPPPIKSSVDEAVWSKEVKAELPAAGWSGRFHSSYVLLAACGRDQQAMEDPRVSRGLFSNMLLKVLDSDQIGNLTYSSLMHKLSMPQWQTPHCEGQGINWRVFNNSSAGADPALILTKREKNGSNTLQAGEAQGVAKGSRYAVYASDLIESSVSPNPRLGHVLVTYVGLFSATVEPVDYEPRFVLPRLCYSKLVQPASRSISVYCDDKAWLSKVFPTDIKEEIPMVFADRADSCDLQLSILEGKVYFDRYHPLVTPELGSRIRYTLAADDHKSIRDVVGKSQHFYYHLTRTGPDNFRGVWMELKALKPEKSLDFDIIYKPTGKNYIQDNPATVPVDSDEYLGMTIFNQTERALYPYLFFFDPTELSIIEWYRPPFGAGQGSLTTRVDAPLPSRSMLGVGYGDGGVDPWQFTLPDGAKKDVGFFKLFLSTRPAFFESILQESPFAGYQGRGGRPKAPQPVDEETWGSQLVTVIQVEK